MSFTIYPNAHRIHECGKETMRDIAGQGRRCGQRRKAGERDGVDYHRGGDNSGKRLRLSEVGKVVFTSSRLLLLQIFCFLFICLLDSDIFLTVSFSQRWFWYRCNICCLVWSCSVFSMYVYSLDNAWPVYTIKLGCFIDIINTWPPAVAHDWILCSQMLHWRVHIFGK